MSIVTKIFGTRSERQVKKMNPILVICLSGVVGYLLYGL